jgi:transglutaminase-like putative cysteine protease
MMVALYLSLMVPLHYLVAGAAWIGWYLGFGGLVFAIGGLGRAAGLSDRLVGLIQVLTLPLAQVLAFASDVAWLWVVPNQAVVDRFWEMGQALGRSFLIDIAPLPPADGMHALIGVSGGLLAWAFDWYTVTLRAPAATGMFAFLVLVVTVAFVRSGLSVWTLAPTAACYLGLLAASAPAWPGARLRWRPGQRRAAGASAVVAGALALGLGASLLPGMAGGALVRGGQDWDLPGEAAASADRQVVGAGSPLVDVSRDLRQQANFEVLRYATAATAPVYLRLTTLSEFDGAAWRPAGGSPLVFDLPTNSSQDGALALDSPVAPLGGVEQVAVQIVALESDWLPAPYLALDLWGRPQTVGLVEADRTLSAVASAPGELSYTVLWGTPGDLASAAAAAAGGGAGVAAPASQGDRSFELEEGQTVSEPAVEDDATYLVGEYRFGPGHGDRWDSGQAIYGPLAQADRYLALPPDLPAVIGQTARQAVAGAAADPAAGAVPGALAYAQAEALVSYFEGAGFEYSLDAPADGDDQGEIIARFLADKAGYCVHYAAAMTLMARELGIPARLAVGYLPGQRLGAGEPGEWALDADGREISVYAVGADRLHSWPELYIEGLGWTAFEPTVGAAERVASAGASPSPSARRPSASPSLPSGAASSPGPSPPPASPGRASGGPASLAISAGAIFGLLAVVACGPGLGRAVRRRRRLRAGLAGAWDELRASAIDLGVGLPPWRTPADLAAEIGAVLGSAGQAAAAADLAALTAAVEASAYGPPPGGPAPGPGPGLGAGAGLGPAAALPPGSAATPVAVPGPALAPASPPGSAAAAGSEAVAESAPAAVLAAAAQARAVIRALAASQPRRVRLRARWLPPSERFRRSEHSKPSEGS